VFGWYDRYTFEEQILGLISRWTTPRSSLKITNTMALGGSHAERGFH